MRTACAILLATLCAASGAVADDAAMGEIKSAPCIACHGADGNTPIADYPKIAGQSRKYLLHTMREYKSGVRPDALMAAQMAPLSDDDLRDLAAYYAKLPGDLQ